MGIVNNRAARILLVVFMVVLAGCAGVVIYIRHARAVAADNFISPVASTAVKEGENTAYVEGFRDLYRDVQINHSITDQEVQTLERYMLDQDPNDVTTTGMALALSVDATSKNTRYFTLSQVQRIALDCKPLLKSDTGLGCQAECTLLYRSKLPEAADDILPFTQSSDPHVRHHAVILMLKLGHDVIPGS